MKSKVKFKGKLRSYMSWPLYLTIVWVCFDIPACIYDYKFGIPMVGFTAIYFALVLLLYSRSRVVLTNEIVNFATQFGTVQKKLLDEFQIPYALLDYTGKILWVNEQFMETTGIDRKYQKSIATIFPTLTREFLQKNEELDNLNVEYHEKNLRVCFNRIYIDSIADENGMLGVDSDEEYLTALYLFDETELNRSKLEIQEQKQVSALVYIDNYDEALDSIEDVKRSLLVALIDRRVNQYFAKSDALVRKIEKDKYFVVFKYKYLAEMQEDKFHILEEVKGIKVGNEMAVTLSIGVGIKGDKYNENYEYARAAIGLRTWWRPGCCKRWRRNQLLWWKSKAS